MVFGEVRRPVLTVLSAISFVCFLLTLSAWAMACLFPRCRFALTWHDEKHRIAVRSKIVGWSGKGVLQSDQEDVYRDADEDRVAPGYENDPQIVNWQQQKRQELQGVRMSLSRLTPADTRGVVWQSTTSELRKLLPSSPHQSGTGGERYSFATPATWFAPLPSLRLAVVCRDYWRRKHERLAGRCVKCGYDLRASPDRCPECGAPVSSTAPGRPASQRFSPLAP